MFRIIEMVPQVEVLLVLIKHKVIKVNLNRGFRKDRHNRRSHRRIVQLRVNQSRKPEPQLKLNNKKLLNNPLRWIHQHQNNQKQKQQRQILLANKKRSENMDYRKHNNVKLIERTNI